MMPSAHRIWICTLHLQAVRETSLQTGLRLIVLPSKPGAANWYMNQANRWQAGNAGRVRSADPASVGLRKVDLTSYKIP